MSTGNSAALAALNQAIELEVEGQRFYLEAAECTTDPRGAEMFRSLADDEVINERILRRQINALTQGEGWVPVLPVPSAAEGSTVEGLPEGVVEVTTDLAALVFPEREKVCGEAVRSDDSDLDALLFALQIENKSFNLYRELAQTTDDSNGKRMYAYLAEAERGHFERLMLNYEHLSTAGSWAE
jgi:rubrerythrin